MSECGESVCTACISPPCTVVGDGVVSVSQGDFVIPATRRSANLLCLAQDEPLPVDQRYAGQEWMPDGTNRFTVGGKTVLLGIHVDCGDLRRQNSTCCGPEPGLPLRLWCLHRLRRRVKEVASVPAEAAVEPEVVSVTADAAVEREVATVPSEVAVEPEVVEPLVVEPEAVAPVEVQRWNPKSPP